MSYIDIAVTAVHLDRIESGHSGPWQSFHDGRWTVEIVVVGSDLEIKDFKRLVRNNSVLRLNITENE